MDISEADIRALRDQGDLVEFVRSLIPTHRAKPRDPAISVRCPWCTVRSGERCTQKTGARSVTGTHQARIDAYALGKGKK